MITNIGYIYPSSFTERGAGLIPRMTEVLTLSAGTSDAPKRVRTAQHFSHTGELAQIFVSHEKRIVEGSDSTLVPRS